MSEKPTVLVVDDTPENIDVLAGVLRDKYRVKVATNGERALKIALSDNPPDLVLLDIMMPGMSGYEVCEALKADPRTRKVPVIFVTAMNEVADEQRGFEVGGVDYITKPVSPPLVLARVATHLDLFDQNRVLDRKVQERTVELNQTRLEVIRRLGRAAEYKDNETGLHVIRMSHYSRIIAEGMGYSDDYCDTLLNAAPMHDIGKIGIPDRVLLKPGRLDDEEWAIMHKHPEMGARIIGEHSNELLAMAAVVALGHHEKWDGSGYPGKLVAEDIPIEARFVAIADVFDALTTERPYKKAWEVEKAVSLIQENAGGHFDPTMVPVFIERLDDVLAIKKAYAERPGETLELA